jgi:hypothetical protein
MENNNIIPVSQSKQLVEGVFYLYEGTRIRINKNLYTLNKFINCKILPLDIANIRPEPFFKPYLYEEISVEIEFKSFEQ